MPTAAYWFRLSVFTAPTGRDVAPQRLGDFQKLRVIDGYQKRKQSPQRGLRKIQLPHRMVLVRNNLLMRNRFIVVRRLDKRHCLWIRSVENRNRLQFEEEKSLFHNHALHNFGLFFYCFKCGCTRASRRPLRLPLRPRPPQTKLLVQLPPRRRRNPSRLCLLRHHHLRATPLLPLSLLLCRSFRHCLPRSSI
jgi:hypothetical protein